MFVRVRVTAAVGGSRSLEGRAAAADDGAQDATPLGQKHRNR